MNAKRLSHADCAHASTKVARAKCRRQLQKMVETIVAVASVAVAPSAPLMLMPAPIALSRTEYCTVCATEFETIADENLDIDPVCHVCSTIVVADVSQIVDRENWREYKGRNVSLTLQGASETLSVQISGWSATLIQYRVNGEGKTIRQQSSRVVSVTA